MVQGDHLLHLIERKERCTFSVYRRGEVVNAVIHASLHVVARLSLDDDGHIKRRNW